MKAILVTNNPLVAKNPPLSGISYKIEFIEGKLIDVLVALRDYVHKGHVLLTHPLSGSVKPNENPFKSALISTNVLLDVDADSLAVIENCIICAKKFTPLNGVLTGRVLDDFMTVDLSLVTSALVR